MSERSTRQFACRYFHDGAWWGIHVSAYDWDDAATRAQKLGLQLDGEIGAIIPAITSLGLRVRLLTALRNFVRL